MLFNLSLFGMSATKHTNGNKPNSEELMIMSMSIPKGLAKDAKAHAKKLGTTVSDLIRALLYKELGLPYKKERTPGGDTSYAKTHEALVAQAALMRQARKAKRERELQEALARADELASAKKKENA